MMELRVVGLKRVMEENKRKNKFASLNYYNLYFKIIYTEK